MGYRGWGGTSGKRSSSRQGSNKSHYVYTLNLQGGKKYVGSTSNLERRMQQHFNGKGSMVTRECPPVSIHSVKKCKSLQKAKNAEKIVYHNMKNYHGTDKVRGAGNTTRFSLTRKNRPSYSQKGAISFNHEDACDDLRYSYQNETGQNDEYDDEDEDIDDETYGYSEEEDLGDEFEDVLSED